LYKERMAQPAHVQSVPIPEDLRALLLATDASRHLIKGVMWGLTWVDHVTTTLGAARDILGARRSKLQRRFKTIKCRCINVL